MLRCGANSSHLLGTVRGALFRGRFSCAITTVAKSRLGRAHERQHPCPAPLTERRPSGDDFCEIGRNCTYIRPRIFADFRITRVFQAQNRMFRLLWGVLLRRKDLRRELLIKVHASDALNQKPPPVVVDGELRAALRSDSLGALSLGSLI